jgi:hypothetical protein
MVRLATKLKNVLRLYPNAAYGARIVGVITSALLIFETEEQPLKQFKFATETW